MLPQQRNQLTISILSRLRKEGAPAAAGENPNLSMDNAGFEPSGDQDQMNQNEVMLGDEDLDSDKTSSKPEQRKKKARMKPGPVSEF